MYHQGNKNVAFAFLITNSKIVYVRVYAFIYVYTDILKETYVYAYINTYNRRALLIY